MKKFHELTEEQRKQAVTFAVEEMKDCIELGLVSFDGPITDETIEEYATCAASEAWYSEPGDKVIHDIATGDPQ
jgi:hypothetical protein